ncbi:hypothetical protein GCM10011579_051870 [Streptomyces albiflavescens]|uniref:DUF3592 domain-containing protein n=1 Tax=Streptomyces albiflavescens TaxID=1623582 RepID=A0A918D5X8_9ACTN|nr:hypothetical protein GCM10011579_051870 [Streptomyces albiflavescens]
MLLGAVFLAIAVFGGCSATLQWQRAELIDDTGIRVTGVVSRIIDPGTKYQRQEISYPVDHHRHTVVRNLDTDLSHPKPGHRVCLEVARTHPGVVRMCGTRYPKGDDMYPVYILVTVFGTAGLLFVIGYLVTGARQTRRIGITA